MVEGSDIPSTARLIAMCGINGFNWKDERLAERMNAATRHRGPDGEGVYTDECVSLGHNRLAIIDLSVRGAQPMRSADGNLVISFNGEIYNFLELRADLHGYEWQSESDTEVILAAYKKWGDKAFARFNGIFALALWDNTKRELLLVRDRAGIKPLYYHFEAGKLVFSSEIKGILEHGMPRMLDREAFDHYLRILYVPAPLTLFAGIKKLEPGMILRCKDGAISQTSFLTELAHELGAISNAGLRDVIDGAVRRQLVSDRPLGIYLSGGLDSNIILDSASRIRSGVDTFSVGFRLGEEENPEKYNADVTLAKRSAVHYGSKHHEVLISSDEAVALFEDMVWHLDEPVANPTTIPMMHLAAFTKPTATVVCGGDGGDELFGGYPRYSLSLLSSYYRMLPSIVRGSLPSLNSQFSKLDTAPGVERFAKFLFQKDAQLSRVLREMPTDSTSRFFEEHFFSPLDKDFERQFMDVDRRSWLVDESLLRTDKMAMASAVESRVPFLDNEVVAFAARVPRSEKVTLRETKKMLRRSFRGRLPDFLFREKKRGWFSPAGVWLRHERFGNMAREILSPSYYEPTRNLFKWDEVQALFEAHHSSREYHLNLLWSLMVFQVWARRFHITV